MNYNPDAIPPCSPDTFRTAEEMRMHVVNVMCFDPHTKKDGVSFVAVVPFVPRIGETIILQDERLAKVANVYYKVVPLPMDGKTVTLTANVSAHFVEQKKG